MILEMHDGETGNSLFAMARNIDYVYQAEEWIKDTMDVVEIIRWELKDMQGEICIRKWERPEGSLEFPKLIA